jgi:hypothetical protein
MFACSPRWKQWWPLPAISQRWRHLIETGVAELAEAARLGASEIEYLTHDTCLSESDLPSVERDTVKSADSLDFLAWRMQQIDFDAEEIVELEPQLMRDLQRVCSSCASKRKCKHDLAKRPSSRAWLGYCPNAPTLAAMIAERALLSPIADWRAGPDG